VLGRAIFDGIMSETVALYLWDFKLFKTNSRGICLIDTVSISDESIRAQVQRFPHLSGR